MSQPSRPVIIAEDDPSTRKLLHRQLERQGYQVSSFENGRPALDAVCVAGGGLVIADWMMPAMDGIELCSSIRDLHQMGAVGNTYVILLTSHSAKDEVIRGLEAGANDYLTKPYDIGELLARIRVGERMLKLQEEIIHERVEVQKANAQMAILAQKLEHQANTDMLTGLSNRRYLFAQLDALWPRVANTPDGLTCCMLDIDHFKKINDTYGHHAGDMAIQRVAAAIRNVTRPSDLAARFGGEEFVVVVTGLNSEQAAAVGERLRNQISCSAFVCEGRTISMTASVGVALLRVGETAHALISRADEMLYAAKKGGRNRVCLVGFQAAEPVLPRPTLRAAGAETATGFVVPRSQLAAEVECPL